MERGWLMSVGNGFAGVVLVLAVVGLAVVATGCSEEVYHGLSERRANELIVALEQEGIRADKVKDPAGEAKWMVTVPGGEEVQAWQVLEQKGLPRPEVEGFGSYYPTGGLIPTASEERILYQHATAQELRKTLLKIDGVVDAQVNLVLPEKPRVKLANQEVEQPRASVLVTYRAGEGSDPPVPVAEVERLMVGGVERLTAERVEVVMTEAGGTARPTEGPAFEQVGPVSVAPRSKGMLQGVVGLLGGIIALLGGGIVFLLWRRMGDEEETSLGGEVEGNEEAF
jgi:type III secretion protein J